MIRNKMKGLDSQVKQLMTWNPSANKPKKGLSSTQSQKSIPQASVEHHQVPSVNHSKYEPSNRGSEKRYPR